MQQFCLLFFLIAVSYHLRDIFLFHLHLINTPLYTVINAKMMVQGWKEMFIRSSMLTIYMIIKIWFTDDIFYPLNPFSYQRIEHWKLLAILWKIVLFTNLYYLDETRRWRIVIKEKVKSYINFNITYSV